MGNKTSTVSVFSAEEIPVFYSKNMMELQLISSSKGNQRKWYEQEKGLYVKEQFFYQGRYWKDYLVEIISSEIGKQLPFKCAKVLQQQLCKIVDLAGTHYGVYSYDFAPGLSYVSFKRIIDARNSYFDVRADIATKWDFVLESVHNFCELDYTDYLITMTLLDYLIGNEDRHINNFGVLQGDAGFLIPPLFDFGLGMFEHDLKYEHVPFRECLQMMYSKPFHADNQKVVDFIAKRYNLDDYLPKYLDLTGVEIPSPKAGSYLRNRCMKLGIGLKGVE
ncbi:hypothetical protein D7V86_01380 [bacterium D16-51]|nr:hypothetical protein D7V96_03940 [bacterium D16-59]RKI62879.1 hypothetical protein D7V86_01380 [bacterium D16-51]